MAINGSDWKPSDHQRRSHTLENVLPPPGSRHYSSLPRSRSVTISSDSNNSMPKSKMPRLIVDSLHRRNPQPDGVQKKTESVRGRVKKSSKLRSIISIVFPGYRRRRSSSLSSRSLSSSSTRSITLRSAMHKDDSHLNSSLSSSSSRSSMGAKSEGKKKTKKKRQNSDGGGVGGKRGITVNSANNGGGRISRGNSLPRNGIKVTRRKGEEEENEERYELCKKKILMGIKCKPLNSSGKLRYDGDGVLIPEPLPP